MKVVLATLCLNEAEFLPMLYEQHKDWPGMVGWMFSHAACRTYQKANPSMVTPEGLSVDDTAEILRDLARRDPRIYPITAGWAEHEDQAQEKITARNHYLEQIDVLDLNPDLVVVIDGDEAYTHAHQARINELAASRPTVTAWRYPQRHIWRPPGSPWGLFDREAIGAYFNVAHCRVWRYSEGMRYVRDHNTPTYADGTHATRTTYRGRPDGPQCVHLGFARSLATREATNRFYVERGEGREPAGQFNRQMYVDCRRAFCDTDAPLPPGMQIVPYEGPVPEVFHEQRTQPGDPPQVEG